MNLYKILSLINIVPFINSSNYFDFLNVHNKSYSDSGYERFNDSLDLVKNTNDKNLSYTLEINYFAARIAKVALWLVDHQMNMELSDIFGINYARIPIYDPKNIVVENSLTYDWNKLIDKKDCSYIIGNPPFVGSKKMDKNQVL
mgnify:CR=1 FL=1